jgi:hypothetical protein
MTDDELDKRIAALSAICDNLKQDGMSGGGGNESFALDTNDLISITPSMIPPLTSSQISTITIGGGGGGSSSGNMWTTTTSSPGSTYVSSPITTTMPGIGHTMPGGAGTYFASGPGGPSWTGTTTSNQANLKITGKNPTLSTEKSEINIDELADLISILKERLLILIPNFEKQEKYQALKKAYDHYKMIEALIQEEKIDVPK